MRPSPDARCPCHPCPIGSHTRTASEDRIPPARAIRFLFGSVHPYRLVAHVIRCPAYIAFLLQPNELAGLALNRRPAHCATMAAALRLDAAHGRSWTEAPRG